MIRPTRAEVTFSLGPQYNSDYLWARLCAESVRIIRVHLPPDVRMTTVDYAMTAGSIYLWITEHRDSTLRDHGYASAGIRRIQPLTFYHWPLRLFGGLPFVPMLLALHWFPQATVDALLGGYSALIDAHAIVTEHYPHLPLPAVYTLE